MPSSPVRVAAAGHSPNHRWASGSEHNGSMRTVLVVEDERDIREVLRRYLERAGFRSSPLPPAPTPCT